MDRQRVLISGGGIAGLTFAIALKRHGFDPLVIEREPALRRDGYMMDFAGTGWDVAERLDLIPALRAVRYPIDALEFVDRSGEAYLHVPIERLRRALDHKYVYLRRQDLERILADRAREVGIDVRYAMSIASIENRSDAVHLRFENGENDAFPLVVGADGVHSRVRELAFGPERQFARFLGLYAAAFHVPSQGFHIGRNVKLYEETNRVAYLYPLNEGELDATLIFRHGEIDVPHGRRFEFLRERYQGAGWITQDVFKAYTGDAPVFFDSVTQIVMPRWHKGRIALIGDACGCLTLLAGQGSHMAMAAGFVLAQELARQADHTAAFAAYEKIIKPPTDKKQRDAARFAGLLVPSANSRPWLRRLTLRLMFSKTLLRYAMILFGTRSILRGYP
jgi:2-polyprenyl-6-methoxyphenol hydroxylase-like FAD-dependent oxidoreductase